MAFHGVEVPAGLHMSEDRLLALRDGSFAAGLLHGAMAAIRPDDRVLHLGAADGVVTAVIARTCHPTFVMGFEEDPALVAQACALHRHNGLEDRISIRHGQVLADPDAPHHPDSACADAMVGTPITCHGRLRRACLHNVLLLEIAGAERSFLRHANLSGVRLVLVALHPGLYGRDGVRDCRRALSRAGYERDLALSRSAAGAEVDVFRRVRA